MRSDFEVITKKYFASLSERHRVGSGTFGNRLLPQSFSLIRVGHYHFQSALPSDVGYFAEVVVEIWPPQSLHCDEECQMFPVFRG